MKKIVLDPEQLKRMHWDEKKHVIEMAAELGVSRATIYREMKAHEIPWRGQSEAGYLKASQYTADERQNYSRAAHDAVRGKARSLKDRSTRAKGVETVCRLSAIEEIFAAEFAACGLFPIAQYAVGKFNVDFAFVEQRIAVEIDPGNWHGTRKKRQIDGEKDRLLQALGWTVVRCSGREIRSKNPLLNQIARDHVTRLLEML
jgi:very-short-patch-repair endonuclease